MQRIVIGIGLAVMAASPTLAADMPVKARPAPIAVAVTTWSGCYIGANIGAGWSDQKYTVVSGPSTGETRYDFSSDGIVGGGQVGCDLQYGQFVFGIQGMWDASGIEGRGDVIEGTNVTAETKVSSFATLTGRVGYAAQPNWLLYVKGGGAWVRSKHTEFVTNTGALFNGPEKLTHSGWTIGGGVEWMFAPGWSAFVEYNYMDLKEKFAPVLFFNIQQDVQVVLVGLNYRFGGGPVVARY
jgi:outer membrane immunogenic protein